MNDRKTSVGLIGTLIRASGSLWLAASLVRWLPWAWRAWSFAGMVRLPPRSARTVPKVVEDLDLSHGTVLYMEDVSVSFDGFKAINELSLTVEPGEMRAIIGPNGAGKTTVFNCLTGFYKPTVGMITMRRRNGETFLLERLPDNPYRTSLKSLAEFSLARLS